MKTKLGQIWTDAVAYVMLLAGAGLSILFNVVNTLDRRGALVDWVDWVIAIAAPGMVVGMVEVFVNRRWVGMDWYMQVLRWLSTLLIGGVAMRVSWTHGHELLLSRGQTGDVAGLFPLSIDALAMMATGLILSGRGHVPAVQQDIQAPIVDTPEDKPAVSDVLDTLDIDTLDTLKATVQDIPEDNYRTGWSGLVQPAEDTGDTQDLSIDDSDLDSWLRGLTDRTDSGQGSVQAYRLPPAPVVTPDVLPRRTRNRAADLSEVPALMAAGRANGAYSVGQLRELLAAWYEVHPKSIQRAEASQ